MSTTAIIIPSWNTKELLKNCLDSLKSLPPDRFEIIVVDNGSVDGSWEIVKKDFPRAKLLRNEENIGFAKANNLAAKHTKSDLLFFLNSDTVVGAGTIETLTDFLLDNQKVGAVSPLIFNTDGSVQKDPCFLRLPGMLLLIVYYNKFLRNLFLRCFPMVVYSTNDFEQASEVEQLSGAALLVKREIFESVGGFDEDFPVYFEDSQLSLQIRKLGYKLMVIPKTNVVHFGRKSMEPTIKKEGENKFYYLNFYSLLLFCKKNYSSLKFLGCKLIVLFHLTLSLRFEVVKRLIWV